MPKPPSRRNKATSAASTDSTSVANSANEDISQQVDPATATINVTAVEVPELTEQEISDKPDGMATLTACTWRGKWNGRFLKRERL
ncbi:hypothetical protein [Nostoc foliaceum]|uniref:hypothetical protein n=1 Tax=Nostoc foliaceum TaxID=2692914 RepID=UPI0036F2656F